MTTSSPLQFQAFDAEAFGAPFYRVIDPRSPELELALAKLAEGPPSIVDAKLPAEDVETGARLMRAGFRKVCVQIELRHALDGSTPPPQRSHIEDRVVFPDTTLSAHARHFVYDRFALDGQLPAAGHDRLYEKWMRNSLEGSAHAVAVSGSNFITFKLEPERIKIDLVSVLDKGQGIATDLLRAVLERAREHKCSHVEVVTECENLPAVRLYLKSGFAPVRFHSVFHLVRT